MPLRLHLKHERVSCHFGEADGRCIFDNIRKAVSFIFAVYIPIAGLSMLPIFPPGWPLLLFPVHIVFLELVIDPSAPFVLEQEREQPYFFFQVLVGAAFQGRGVSLAAGLSSQVFRGAAAPGLGLT